MTSRERLLTALRGKMPDRVPANLYEINPWAEGSFYTTESSWKGLVGFLKENSDPFGWGGVNLGSFHSDPAKIKISSKTRQEGNSTFISCVIETPKGPLTTESRTDAGVATSWALKHMIENDEDIEKFLSIEYEPFQPDLAEFYKLEEVMKKDGRGVMLISLGDAVGEAAGMMDFEFFATKSVEDKKTMMELIDTCQQRWLAQYDYMAKNVRDTVFRICGPEYVTPPLMPPSYFHDFVAAPDRELSRAIRKHSGNNNFVCIHSHSKIVRLLDEIASIEIDVLEPVESLPATTADTTLKEVRDKLGSRVCLMGNIQTRYIDWSPKEELDAFIKTAIYEGGAKGGFVLIPTGAPIVSPLPEKTVENIHQYFESARKYGHYPLK
ncbi:hypothetical protein COY52_00235 [Candidatus Desantisbacteria bacterium CG_4_10_14_0_8_um_filter_48_22]|uniref:Uroporphyrinogen decarboxylase (URO-D) domain-containing protein n=1 Tax=Candidatus Desantisbacteria bacterium CG_4_10_14_0_8_um_filter_48_22 TaxID=1974543 RepID=A0A2M7SG68_9BACT|nr:MAG: hypothetical protein AUJ67_08590 [Candidatus Desantisbacteria bacterium CG1_02_49_89]PIV56184.1 MAG: hypothetical protein COS16_04745 [Candidatus Desantisbacteria bacterium CG02_land_8_20_14_3_00_49_13]PIZ18283.1 MAG: hypothetical protein COY52_00235 [Candidatus Desantisbacteria bacterium CG_4_10_14_0_8_um_filter_48_22]PJB27321.1 MAG: hypothetical protein CO111_05960 [Candidatus Desantisbacteria bacterium CG_4_9_14_3_um_filter_50_7]